MDLDNLTPSLDAEPMQLVHPATGVDLETDGKPVRLFILGPDTPKMQAIERAIQGKRLKAASRTGKVSLTVEEIEAETIDRLATSIVGWENLQRGGKPLEYSHEEARKLMRDLVWMRDQVDAFGRDRGNFLAASGKTSKSL